VWESDSTADDVAENVKRAIAIHTAIGIFVTVTSLNMVSVTYQNPPLIINGVLVFSSWHSMWLVKAELTYLPLLFDNYIQISSVYHNFFGPFNFGALLQIPVILVGYILYRCLDNIFKSARINI
jgi:hypothetical protein